MPTLPIGRAGSAWSSRRLLTLAAIGALLLLLVPVGHGKTSAQENTDAEASARWSIRILGDYAYYRPLRNFGHVSGAVGIFSRLQAAGKIGPTQMAGAGIEISFPGDRTWARLMGRTTVGGQADAHVGLCNLLPGDVCDPLLVDAAVRSIHGLIGFRQRPPGSVVQPSLFVGGGLRNYTFGEADCGQFAGDPHMLTVCGFMATMFEDPPSLAPFLELGIEVALVPFQRVAVDLRLLTLAGSFGGSTGGTFQNDLAGSAGLSIQVR